MLTLRHERNVVIDAGNTKDAERILQGKVDVQVQKYIWRKQKAWRGGISLVAGDRAAYGACAAGRALILQDLA